MQDNRTAIMFLKYGLYYYVFLVCMDNKTSKTKCETLQIEVDYENECIKEIKTFNGTNNKLVLKWESAVIDIMKYYRSIFNVYCLKNPNSKGNTTVNISRTNQFDIDIEDGKIIEVSFGCSSARDIKDTSNVTSLISKYLFTDTVKNM